MLNVVILSVMVSSKLVKNILMYMIINILRLSINTSMQPSLLKP
jgi:hypothetical protein